MPDIGDIKSSLLTINHNGWYNLNGQQIDENTRPFAAQNASTIFGGTFLPDLSDAVLSQQTLKTLSGNNSISLLVDNLPNLNLSGQTASFYDVGNTDLNGSGNQILTNGLTESFNGLLISTNSGAINETVSGTTNIFNGTVSTSSGGAFTNSFVGSTNTFNSLVTSTTQGVTVSNGNSNIVNLDHVHHNANILTAGGGSAKVLGINNGDPLPSGTVTAWGSVYEGNTALMNGYNLHDHSVTVNVPAHSHDVSISIPSLSTNTNVVIPSHTHNVDITIPSLGTSSNILVPPHNHDVPINIPSLNVTGNVTIPNHSHSFDITIPTLAVSVPLNGLSQPLDIKGKRFGVNFFIYLGIG